MSDIKVGDDVFFLRGNDFIQGAILKIKRGRAKLRYVVASSKLIVAGGICLRPFIINGLRYITTVECKEEDVIKVDMKKFMDEAKEHWKRKLIYGDV